MAAIASGIISGSIRRCRRRGFSDRPALEPMGPILAGVPWSRWRRLPSQPSSLAWCSASAWVAWTPCEWDQTGRARAAAGQSGTGTRNDPYRRSRCQRQRASKCQSAIKRIVLRIGQAIVRQHPAQLDRFAPLGRDDLAALALNRGVAGMAQAVMGDLRVNARVLSIMLSPMQTTRWLRVAVVPILRIPWICRSSLATAPARESGSPPGASLLQSVGASANHVRPRWPWP